jgi:hypothetical protein
MRKIIWLIDAGLVQGIETSDKSYIAIKARETNWRGYVIRVSHIVPAGFAFGTPVSGRDIPTSCVAKRKCCFAKPGFPSYERRANAQAK